MISLTSHAGFGDYIAESSDREQVVENVRKSETHLREMW